MVEGEQQILNEQLPIDGRHSTLDSYSFFDGDEAAGFDSDFTVSEDGLEPDLLFDEVESLFGVPLLVEDPVFL